MNSKEISTLTEFATFIAKNNLNINTEFNTRNYDYEVVSYVDEIQIIDLDENVIVSVRHSEVKENTKNE